MIIQGTTVGVIKEDTPRGILGVKAMAHMEIPSWLDFTSFTV